MAITFKWYFGTYGGGKKAAKTNLERDPDFYKRIGSLGGSVITDKPKGFAANPKLASEVGKKVGKRSKRGYKFIEEVDESHGRYENKITGKEVVLPYNRDSE